MKFCVFKSTYFVCMYKIMVVPVDHYLWIVIVFPFRVDFEVTSNSFHKTTCIHYYLTIPFIIACLSPTKPTPHPLVILLWDSFLSCPLFNIFFQLWGFDAFHTSHVTRSELLTHFVALADFKRHSVFMVCCCRLSLVGLLFRWITVRSKYV